MRTLNDRVLEAKAIASLSKIEGRDKANRVTRVLTPASEGTQNQVLLHRKDGAIITVECRKVLKGNNYDWCPGNHAGVCRHAMAAIFVALGDSGYAPRFRTSREAAVKLAAKRKDVALANSDGEPVVFTLRSRNKELYFIAEDVTATELAEKSTPAQPEEPSTPDLTEPFDCKFENIRVGDHLNDPDGGFVSEVVSTRKTGRKIVLCVREAGCGPADDYALDGWHWNMLRIRRPLK